MKQTKLLALILFFFTGISAVKATETEPNNTRNTANTLALNGNNTGAIGISGDEDWWSIATDADGKLNVGITVTNGLYTRWQIYDNDGIALLESDYTSSTKTISVDGLATGTYYVRVYAYYAGQLPAYDISNTLTLPVVINDAEPNNVKANAKNLNLNNSKDGHIGYYYNNVRDSFDWYKVTTNANGRLRVTITTHNGQLVYAYLYDNDGNTLLESGYTSSTAAVINKDGLAPGIYYVRVKAYYSYGFCPYTLADSLFVPAQANDNEPNNISAQAITLAQNATTTGHINYYYNNIRDTFDWYKVTTNADGRLRVTITSHNGQHVYAYLYDNDGSTLLDYDYTSGSANVINKDGLAAGTYYIRVKAYYSGGFCPYTLTDSLFLPEQANDTETNNTAVEAVTFSPNSSVTGHIGYYYNNIRDSFDWYKITTNADGRLSINITSNNGQYVYAYLYDNAGTNLLDNGYTSSSATVADVDGLAPGTYYVRVKAYYSYGFVPYTLTNTFTTYSYANDTEPNAYFSQAKTIPANDSITGHVGFYYNGQSDGEDRWKINYTGSGNLTLIFNQQNRLKTGSPIYTYFRVYKDTNAAPIAGNYYIANSVTLNLTSLTQGYYYIRVYPYNNSPTSYFSSYSIKANFIQTTSAKIKATSYDTASVCTSNNKIVFKASKSNDPYTVQLYRYGVAYGSPITTEKTATFKNLPIGAYYATAFGDGATGDAFGTSKTVNMVPIPTGANTTGISSAKATANWTVVSCAKYYNVQYRIKGEEEWTKKKTTGNAGNYEMKNLLPGTMYEWQVAAVDSANNITATGLFTDSVDFSTTAAFTMSKPGATNSEVIADVKQVSVFPNPAISYFVIRSGVQIEGIISLSLTDMTGKVQFAKTIDAAQINGYRIETVNMNAGMYILQIRDKNNKQVATQKILIKQ